MILESEITKTKPKQINVLDASGILQQERRSRAKKKIHMKDEKVLAKIINIKGKQKRGQSKETVARQSAKRQRQLDAQEEVLAAPAPVGRMTTLRE
jgi:hypothetical protein